MLATTLHNMYTQKTTKKKKNERKIEPSTTYINCVISIPNQPSDILCVHKIKLCARIHTHTPSGVMFFFQISAPHNTFFSLGKVYFLQRTWPRALHSLLHYLLRHLL